MQVTAVYLIIVDSQDSDESQNTDRFQYYVAGVYIRTPNITTNSLSVYILFLVGKVV